ncbi:MAG TPA: SDR family NAD(P)-dependent oxidoreductase [Candidatus Binatia bacterium]|nr:SDR family NAD(P)-dependent oxidoreductase [Candidatus Binatia bacterium]
MYSLTGKVAVVTGAASGIGRALAQAFAARGCRIAIADLNEAGLKETAASLGGAEVLAQKLDVSNRAAVYDFADAVRARFGTTHVVVNNAGVAVSQTVADLKWDDFEWLMGINFWGVTYGTKAFLPQMTAQNEGTIVNISSIFGIVAWPNQSAYNAAKFAVRGFTECLRQELHGTDVRAISVHPGGIKTNIVRNARMYADHAGRTDTQQIQADFERVARTTPEQAAATILRGVERGDPRVLIGPDAKLMDLVQRLFPVGYPAFTRWLSARELAKQAR